MAITRVLLTRLGEEADDCAALAKDLASRLESPTINIKLVPENKENSKQTRSFSKRLEKSRIQRPECLRIIEHQDYLLEALDHHSKSKPEAITKVILVCLPHT